MTTSTTTTEPGLAPEAAVEGALPAEQESTGPEGPTTRQEAVKRAYAEATTALREAHRDEFNSDVQARVKGYGFDWKPKPTAEEKARAEIARLAKEAGLTPTDLAALAQ